MTLEDEMADDRVRAERLANMARIPEGHNRGAWIKTCCAIMAEVRVEGGVVRPRDREEILHELWMSLPVTITMIENYQRYGTTLRIEQRFDNGPNAKADMIAGMQRRIGEIIEKAEFVQVGRDER